MKKAFLFLLAGLLGGSLWADEPFRKHRYDQFKVLPPAEGSIVFVGNSITDMHPWVETFRTTDGQSLPIVNRGNSGTYSTEQSDNLESYLANRPKKLFLMIGTNDIATNGLNYTGEQVLAQVQAMVKHVHLRSPQTKVYLYSILKNDTGNRAAERWLKANELVKAYVEAEHADWLTYIDIYDQLTGIADGGGWSYDKLHPTAASYEVWCREICQYLQEGENFEVQPVYPADALNLQQNGGLQASNGMRATFFSLLPVASTDILFFGDEEVKNGEWNELLHNGHIKNRGTGWGFGGNIATTSGLVDATFAAVEGVSKAAPKAMLLYTGTADMTGTADLETVKTNYKQLVDKLVQQAPDAKVYLLALHPLANVSTNADRVALLNAYMQALAGSEGYEQVRFIDTYTPFLNGTVADTRYIKNTNYLYGLGYVKMAQLIADALGADFAEDSYRVVTEAEAEQYIEQADLRNAVSQAVHKGWLAQTGTQTGQYGEAGMAAFNALAEEAFGQLSQPALTADYVSTATAGLADALNAALNMPVASTDGQEQWYQLHSLRAPDRYVSVSEAAGTVTGDETAAAYARSQWKFVKRSDNTFDIVNRKHGSYLSPASSYNTAISTTASQPSNGWTVSYASTPGCYIVSSGEVQLNQTQAAQQYKIYNWSAQSNKGADRTDAGCQFYINEAPEPIEEPKPAEQLDIVVDKSNGNLYNGTTANASFNSVWRSNTAPQFTFTSNANNMNWNGNNVQLYSGTAGRATYTLNAPEGYVIDSYSFTFANNGHSVQLTLTMDDGQAYTTSATAQTQAAEGVGASAVSFTLAGANGNPVKLTDFTVHLKAGTAASLPRPEVSTAGNEHWYYITSASTKTYCAGKVVYYDAEIDRLRFGDKSFSPDRLWSFWEQNGKLAIKNYDGVYFGTAGAGTGGGTQFGKSDEPNYIYQIEEAYDFFLIKDNAVELHAQETGQVLVRWAAEAGGASLWKFVEADVSHPELAVTSTTVKQGKVTTGIGNKNQPIVRATLTTQGLTGTCQLQAISGQVVADDLADVKRVRAYVATNARELFVDEEGLMPWREANGELFGEAAEVAADGSFSIAGNATLHAGDNHVWIAYDIADEATEGHQVDAVVGSYTIDGAVRTETAGNPAHAVTIFLSEGAALMPYDCGSRYYRIPAITTVKKQLADGTEVDRLVVLTDDRLQHNGDLPNQVYLVAQYSDDLGRSWSRPVRVAGTAELGGAYGHGDASLVTNHLNGDIIGIMTSAGTYGHGFWASTADQPMLWKTITSSDGGETWTVPADHTSDLYGVGSPNPTWKGGFSGSGAALQKRDGTLVSSFVNREADNSQNFYFFMSKDGGQSWYVSGTSGTTSADEPKTLERNNGDLSIFVRANGYNFHNVSSDEGQTWHYPAETRFSSGISGTACDGEYMVWCSTLEGNPWNIAFETLPNSSRRENVSICLSTDEGETFGAPKTICPWGSGYSTAVVLPDGTLGVYYEEDGYYNASNYVLRFVRFSLDWASGGTYKFTESTPFFPIRYTGTATGLQQPYEPTVSVPTLMYDLQGRRVKQAAAPGVYIKNGVKVIQGRLAEAN